ALAVFVGLGIDATRGYLRVFGVPASFLVPGIAVLLVTTNGTPLVHVGPLAVTGAGVDRALRVGVRSIAATAILVYLVVTTPVPQVVGALSRLRIPQPAIEIALLTYRSVQVLLTIAVQRYTAASARLGFTDRRATLRTTTHVGVSLFPVALDRVEKLDAAMRTRGYTGAMPTPTVDSAGHRDAVIVLAALLLAGVGP
ncbi:MAG: energy-coupling factor transporter transmembrane component T family protein, partial [Salinarchaeum sp.]